ncbi:hypothetical protein [Caloranaerobacter sp. DY30410]|uniref:hypothetical protein n=1 Tax=Caloranaerobacter sp. DY30410 TaxID=3238305 RepID=UPI003CFE154B
MVNYNNTLSNSSFTAQSTDYYEKYLNDLRKGNFVESILDIDEGLTETEIYRIGVTHANAAREAAMAEFPDDEMLCDSFRHFVWNHVHIRF